MTIGPDQRFTVATDVHARSFDGETVLVDLRRGDYYGLNELGARLWEGLLAGKTAREVAVLVAPQFEVPLERLLDDLVALTGELADRGLIVAAE